MKLGEMPAFPTEADNANHYSGMTLRQYYAGLAMQGMLANPHENVPGTYEAVATHAARFADSLLSELEKLATPPIESNEGDML